MTKYLRTDSVKSGNIYYVWSYVIDAESTSTIGTSKYRKVTLTVTPRVVSGTPMSGIIRRAKPPTVNALFTP